MKISITEMYTQFTTIKVSIKIKQNFINYKNSIPHSIYKVTTLDTFHLPFLPNLYKIQIYCPFEHVWSSKYTPHHANIHKYHNILLKVFNINVRRRCTILYYSYRSKIIQCIIAFTFLKHFYCDSNCIDCESKIK